MTTQRWSFLRRQPFRRQVLTFSSTVLLTGVLVTGAIALVRQLGWLEASELDAYDWLMQQRPAEETDERLLVVGVTEEDVQLRQEYPIEDGTLAKLLTTLQTYNPRAIGIDIARDVPQGEGREDLLNALTSSDRMIAGCVMSSTDEPGVAPAPGIPDAQVGFADLPVDRQGIIRRSILISTPALTERRPPLVHLCNDVSTDNELLSLSLLLALIYLEDEGVPIQQTATGELQLGSAIVPRLDSTAAGYHQNGATDYQVMLNYRTGEAPIRVVSLTDVLEARINPDWIEDRLVLIGYTSTVAKDHFFTPFSGHRAGDLSTPGVIIHAQSASQLISAALDGRSLIRYWSTGGELLWILAWSVLGGTAGFYAHKVWRFLLVEAMIGAALIAACYGLFVVGIWVPLTPALLGMGITAIGTVLVDRANKSGYSQAFLEQTRSAVHSFLHPSIEIDEEKKAQQLEEITNTTFFRDLKSRAKEIRDRRTQDSQASESPSPTEKVHPGQESP
jgi:adenylate cyclase